MPEFVPQPIGEYYSEIEENISSAYFTAQDPPPDPPDPNVQIIITGVGTYQGLEVSGDYSHRSIVNVTHTGVGGTALYTTGDTALVTKGDTSLGDGTITVGRSASDDVEVLGEFTSNLIPNATSTYDIGSSSRRWDQIYSDYLIATTQVAIGTNTSAATLTIGDVSTSPSNRGALAVKTLPNNGTTTQAALYLEEQVGTEGWYVIVNADGDLNFNNSGASTDAVRFLDDDNVLIAKGKLGINTDVSPTKSLEVIGQAQFSSTVTAPTFVGDLTGIADKARTISTTTAGAYYPVWVDTNNSTAIGEQLYTNSSLQYNPSTNILTVGTVAASLQGSADTAQQVLTQSTAVAGAYYPTFVDTNNTNATAESLWTDAGLAYNPSTNTLTAGFFSGDGSGLTNVTASSSSSATAFPVTSTSDTTCWPVLVGATAGDQTPLYDAGLTYNASTNALTCTTFVGALSGNASTSSQTGTVTTSTNATHYLTFVNSDNGVLTAETIYTDGGILYNPSSNILSTGQVIASGGFRSDSGNPVLITVSGTTLTFTVTGTGSATLTLA